MSLIVPGVALLALLTLSAYFSGSESLLFSLDEMALRRLARQRPTTANTLRQLRMRATESLPTLLIGNTLVNVAASVVFYHLVSRSAPNVGEVETILAMTAILLVVGEYGPKSVALQHSARLAPLVAVTLPIWIRLLAPLRHAMHKITQFFEPWLQPRGLAWTDQEFDTWIEISGQEGVIDPEELSLIRAISSLETMTAADVMTPRVDLKGINLSDLGEDLVAQVRACRRHFMPVYRETLDQIEGLLDVRRFLLDPQHDLAAATQAPFFVPHNVRLNRLLELFQREGRRVAIVVDEHGGTAGMVTRGDILERVTGVVYQELSRPMRVFQEAGPNRWLVDASFSLADLNRKLGLNLFAQDADRLAGWISAQAGHVPHEQEIVEAQGVRVTVLKVERHRVMLAQIEKLPEPNSQEP